MKTLSVYSIKGGVGKTTASANLAYAAAQRGLRTLLLDLDAQGASSFCFRVRPKRTGKARRVLTGGEKLLSAMRASDYPNLDLLPAHRSFRRFDVLLHERTNAERLVALTQTVKKLYDLLVIDAPPGITNLSEALFDVSNRILVPMVPTPLCERTWAQLLAFFSDKGFPKRRLRMFFSMADRRIRLHRDAIDQLRSDKRCLGNVIPRSVVVERMAEKREPVLAYAARSNAGRAFLELSDDVLRDLGLQPREGPA